METVKQAKNSNETVATNATITTPAYFTQDDVDGIVRERLQRERNKYADYESLKEKAEKFDAIEEKNKTELQKANDKTAALQAELDKLKHQNAIAEMHANVAKETGVPVDLLTAETQEDCEAQAKAIMAFAKPNKYPNVPDGGEARFTGKRSTRDQFAEWFNNVDK